jgi:hypothetical protein
VASKRGITENIRKAATTILQLGLVTVHNVSSHEKPLG